MSKIGLKSFSDLNYIFIAQISFFKNFTSLPIIIIHLRKSNFHISMHYIAIPHILSFPLLLKNLFSVILIYFSVHTSRQRLQYNNYLLLDGVMNIS